MQTRQRVLPFSMRLEPDLKSMLQHLADEENRNLTNYVETVLRAHVAAKRAEGGEAKRSARR